MLALKRVFPEFAALVEGIPHAPVYETAHHFVLIRSRLLLSRPDGVTEEIVRCILETPEHALAHVRSDERVQDGIGHAPIPLIALILLRQRQIHRAVISEQITDKRVVLACQPVAAHLRFRSRKRDSATTLS